MTNSSFITYLLLLTKIKYSDALAKLTLVTVFCRCHMFLKDRNSGHLIEVLSLSDLFNLYQPEIIGRDQVGEEAQEPESYKKSQLLFLSGEELPRCWLDPDYRNRPPQNDALRSLHS